MLPSLCHLFPSNLGQQRQYNTFSQCDDMREKRKRTSEVLKRVETPPFVCEGLLRALDPVQVLFERLYSTRCKLFQDESSSNIENIQVERRELFLHT